MPSVKRLNSVCHSIAHHAVSGLSYVHPHVLAACRSARVNSMSINLLDAEPCPESFREIQPLRLSLRGLRAKLEEILALEGFSLTDLTKASVIFTPDPQYHDDYCSICHATLTSRAGKTYQHVLDCIGKSRTA